MRTARAITVSQGCVWTRHCMRHLSNDLKLLKNNNIFQFNCCSEPAVVQVSAGCGLGRERGREREIVSGREAADVDEEFDK